MVMSSHRLAEPYRGHCAMAIYEFTTDQLRKLDETECGKVGIQEWVKPETLLLAEEFGEWKDARQRVELLALDKDRNLVVIALRRSQDGGHMELQAIRSEAMVSTMTLDQTVAVYARFLGTSAADARRALLKFLEWEESEEDGFAQDVPLVWATAEFPSRELTTAVVWLTKRDCEIRCVRIKPYSDHGRVLIDVQPVIPLPGAREILMQLKNKKQKGPNKRARDGTLK
jgi:hypothetical protein